MFTPLNGAEIRKTFLNFFKEKGHEILPSASLVPEDPTVLLTIAGMLPFKPIFLGQKQADFPRATTSQKCIRTNDIENVGRTARHHTFFEMLGNFSFGDYFKPQAIAWAWELSTQVFQLSPQNLVVSVFREDDEAYAIWRDQVGVPVSRIVRMDEADNFWVSGPTGPCGPCSEIYYDFHPEKGDEGIDLEDDSRFIEFYNLVFMQYNRDAEGNLTPLQAQNIDTGLGLERLAQILQQVPNNYETDLILPIINAAAQIAGIQYAQTDEKTKVSLKVIGDHVRAVVHLIADGVTPSNLGRGYILRRLIRRVVRHGRLIGIEGRFVSAVAEVAIALAESAYPHVRLQATQIKAELETEEVQFRKTLDRGEKLLAEMLAKLDKAGKISGAEAFELYDTYGFPLELTQEVAEEKGILVDAIGFEQEMEKQRDRSRSSRDSIDLTVQSTLESTLDQLSATIAATEFLGYGQTKRATTVVALLVDGKSVPSAAAGSEVQIVLAQTPFYAESGGQIGDRGVLSAADLADLLVNITDVQKESAFFVHTGRIERGSLNAGDTVTAQVDIGSRRRAQANHTATHLLQAALKKWVDANISQAGSLVAFDRLRFDFNLNRVVSPTELEQVEAQINQWIAEAHPAQVAVMPIAAAKEKGAIAMFGEKYGDQVRVVDFAQVSMELCGGIHVDNTAEIGLFKVISETGVAAGVRRIEAVSGQAALDYLTVRDKVVRELGDRFKAKPEELPDRITALQTELKITQKQLESLKSELALAQSDQLLGQAEAIGDFKILVAQMAGVDANALQTVAERLLQKVGAGAIVLGSVPEDGKVALVAAFSPGVNQKGLQAGKFIGAIAKICGGGGGGRPNLAQAGGRDPSQLVTALAEAKQQLTSELAG